MEGADWHPIVHRVLAGSVDLSELPEIPPRVVRVYLSSTGIDSQTERNAFVERVYPNLREYCSKEYGVDFQMVDLDWGVETNGEEVDSSMNDFRFDELYRCHSLSAGPNFVAFIGQQYGKRPLPPVIPADEYETLFVALKGHKSRELKSVTLLDDWYQRDENSEPPAYILTNVHKKLPDFLSKDVEKREEARTKWLEDESELRRMLHKGSELCYLEGLFDVGTKRKYQTSVHDMVVQQGTEESGSPKHHCIMITRTIVDLKNYMDEPKAMEFAEISFNDKTEKLEIDETCTNQLTQMKTRAKGLLSKQNVFDYDVLWRYDDVIHPKLHAPYLNKLCKEFHDALKRLIDATVPKTKFDVTPEIYVEVLQHWLCCKRKSIRFYGQEELLNGVKNYLAGFTGKPLVVYGDSGAGKSTLLSKVAADLVANSGGQTISAVRFIGYTPKSSDIKQVLLSLCHQLLHTLGRSISDIPYDCKDLQRYFFNLLQSVPKKIRVVIFLDSLEKLNPEYNAHYLSWLPMGFRDNIKIVVSVHPTKHNILDKLRDEVLKDMSHMIRVTQMVQKDATGLMQYTLGLHSRKLTPLQQNVFSSKFSECSLAMFVQLLTHRAKWIKSFDKIKDSDVPSNIEKTIDRLFDDLEEKHGAVLVCRALAYLVASVTGLSDCEMEDLLSLDDEVLNSMFVTYHPPVRRIPFVKWLKLKSDIEPFLTYREADGVTVYFWAHEVFENAVRDRYLNNENTVKALHSMLADYFLGTWAGRTKPVAMVTQKNNLILPPCGNEADRLVAGQPLSFVTESGDVRYNKRKYDQLPRHLYLAGRLKELNSLVLFNYEWLYNKIKALSLTHIMADFVLNPGEEATLIEEALRVAEATIQNDINNLAPEISGHLLPYYKTHPNIRALVQQCDTAGLKHCALIPNFPYLQVPGSSLQYTLTSSVCGDYYRLTYDDRYLLLKVKDSSLVHRFDVATGEAKKSVFASNGDLYVTPNGKLFVIVDHFTEKAIKIHKSDTGDFVGQLIVMNHVELKVKEKYKLGDVCLTDDRMTVIVTTDMSYLCIADLEECQFLQIIRLVGKCDLCRISPNGKYVFGNSNEFLFCYDLYSREHICTVSTGYRPTALAFTRDGFRGFHVNAHETKLLVMHVHRGNVEMAYKVPLEEVMPEDKIVDLQLSPNDDMLLIRGLNNILVYNRFTEKVTVRFPRPPDVPKEFKLPKSYYTDLHFTNACFSRDGNFVIASLFRNLYLWQVSTGNKITTIQAPVGVITEMLISKQRSQVITHLRGSKDVQVWNIDEAVNQVNMLDKLTSRIEEIKLAADNSIAYVRCRDSDELGVIDMRNGIMLDLLTHDAPVRDFASTPDGQYVIVSSNPKKRNSAVKIWDMDERKVVKEFGNTVGFCIGGKETQSIIFVSQEELDFKAPFCITKFSFMDDSFRESTHPLSLKYILDRPFLTNNDQHVVVLTAQGYIETEGQYDTPTICAFSLDDDYKVSYYTPESFQGAVKINTIKKVQTYNRSSENVIVLFSTNSVDQNDNTRCHGQLGMLVLNITSGAITTICEQFLCPGISIGSITFSDIAFCIDGNNDIFDITQGRYVLHLDNPGVPPSAIALFGKAVIYYKGSLIFVVSLRTGKQIARCEVHSSISNVTVCSDERTLIIGCHDGTVVSYVLIDPDEVEDDAPEDIVASLGSRSLDIVQQNGRMSRSWDRAEDSLCPTYSRPPSAVSHGPKEKILLKQVQPVSKVRPNSDTLLYLNEKSKTCSIQ